MPFQKGNPGRPKGSKNRVTVAAKAFLEQLCDDPKVQAAVKKRILEGDSSGFFRAVDKIVPDPPRDLNVRGEMKMIVWPTRVATLEDVIGKDGKDEGNG